MSFDASAPPASPGAPRRRTPPSTTCSTSRRAVALDEAGADRGALAGGADDGDRRAPGRGRPGARGCRGRARRASPGCGRPPTRRARARRGSASSSARSCSSGDGDPLDRLDRQPLLAPARHPAREVAGDPPDADRGGELGGAQRVVVVAADQHDLLVGAGDPRQPRAEARLQDRVADRARDVRVVELLRGADVDHRRARAARPGAASAARRRSGGARSGPRLIATIAWKFGGCGRRLAVERATNSSSSATPSSSLWRRS